MDFEEIIWGYVPILVSLIEIFISIKLSAKRQTSVQWILTILICALNIFAVYILIRMLNNAWPTYTPHFGILISTILLIVQYLNKKTN